MQITITNKAGDIVCNEPADRITINKQANELTLRNIGFTPTIPVCLATQPAFSTYVKIHR